MAEPSAELVDTNTWKFRRELPGSTEELWEYVANPDKTMLWIGPFSICEQSGTVQLTMIAEEPGPPMESRIIECERPHRLKLDTGMWVLTLVVENGAIELHQDIATAQEAAAIGPGWEFYLDRLQAAVCGRDPNSVDFEADYFPTMSRYFESRY